MNIILTALLRVIIYSMIGLVALCVTIIYEVTQGTGMTHPIWSRSYDWMPVVMTIIVGSSIVALLRTLVGSVRIPRRSIRIPVVADFNWGKEHRVSVRNVRTLAR